MFLIIILLAIIAWLLWNIREDIQQLAARQRDQAAMLERLAGRPESPAATWQTATAETAAVETAALEPVNLNTASKTRLQTLPGVGNVTAGAIIAARPFTRIEQLADVAGVNAALYEQLRERVTL
jgi:competence ComEA-like helix-hairpin-helix protein